MRNFKFRVTRRGFRRIKVLAVSWAIAPYIYVDSLPRLKNGLLYTLLLLLHFLVPKRTAMVLAPCQFPL